MNVVNVYSVASIFLLLYHHHTNFVILNLPIR